MGATDARRYYDDDGDHAVVYLGEPIRSGYVLIQRDHLANLTSLEHARRQRAHPNSAGRWASASSPSPRVGRSIGNAKSPA